MSSTTDAVITVIGMLAWPVLAFIVLAGFLFAIYGLTWALIHWFDKNEVPDDRDSATDICDVWQPIDVDCPDNFGSCKPLPTRSINRKINPEPGRKL